MRLLSPLKLNNPEADALTRKFAGMWGDDQKRKG